MSILEQFDRTRSDNIMTSLEKKNKKFIDRVDKNHLLPISKIKTIFESYNHDILDRYKQSMVWHDVGALFFLIYIKRKYRLSCDIHIDERELINRPQSKTLLEWIGKIDYEMDEEDSPKYLIYYKNQKFYYDSKLITKNNKLQIHIVSHTFPVGSGHLGCIFIKDDKAYYYDPNGLKDPDEATYYDVFESNLSVEMNKYGIVYYPYRWKKGIQSIQNNEELKYGIDIMGMCCSWTYLMIELKLMNPGLTIEDIENKLKKKYMYYLTRMIVTYQQSIHQIIFDLSKEYYELNCKNS